MHIGNNRPDGPRPQKQQQGSGLDPDLTASNREGIASTTRTTRAQTQRSIEARSPAKSTETRKAADSFERSKPEQDPGVDVSQRIKNARAQAGQQRVENARAQAGQQRVENGRAQAGQQRVENGRAQADQTRIEGAREQRPDAPERVAPDKGKRIANARAQASDNQSQRIAQARAQEVGVDGTAPENAKRIANTRGQHTERADNSGGQERVANARAQAGDVANSQRIENARVQYRKNSQVDTVQPRDAVQASKISGASVHLPGRSGELPGVSGARESSSARSERVEGLRQDFEAGELNTPERAREAAGRLLGEE